MSMRCMLVYCLLIVTASANAWAADELAREGKSAWLIVIGDEPAPQEKYAAGELQHHLELITGAKLPIVAESAVKDDTDPHPKLLIGQTRLTTQLLPNTDFDALGEDGILLKSAGGNIILYGARRGVVNAVNTFLEDHVGVRWWTSSDSTIPKKPTLTVAPLDVKYVPKFRYREVFNVDVMYAAHATFATRLKLNGQHNHIPPEMGGHYSILGWCHTAFSLVPPGEHFAKHPEWFAQVNGARQTGTQLCLTNKEMQKALIASALVQVRKNPTAGIISVSQNDCFGPCQCDVCQAVVKEENSESGPWIRLCNTVAAEINKEFPDFLVETLAYQYTRKPPKVTRPTKNVLVRLCSIEADFSHPLSGPSNASFGDDLRGWKAIAPNLFIWNYVTNFANYLIPHPNMTPLAADLRFFADHNVIGVFEQGDYSNDRAGDFLPLRTWLLAKLLWDPSQDQQKLQQEFLDGYYGAAGAHLAKYLEIVNAPAKNEKFYMRCYNTETSFLSDDAIAAATKCFDDAVKAVAGDAELARRVRRERLALDHVRLLRYHFAGAVKRHTDPEAARAEYVAKVTEWSAVAKELGVANFSEGQGIAAYIPTLAGRAAQFIPPVIPPTGAKLPDGQFEIQEEAFHLHRPPDDAMLVDDPRASNQRAARMPASSSQWAVQLHLTDQTKFIGKGPWECYVFVRVERNGNPQARGRAFIYGLHDTTGNAFIARTSVDLEQSGDDGYHAYGLTVDELRPGMYLWVSPPASDKKVKAVYVDRMFIRRQQRPL